MSSVVISGDTSGSVTLSAPAVAGTNTITLPAATGTVVLTGTTPTLNGITFPATQVPSADANTLDDYEEGTWTPRITFGGNTSSGQAGTFAGFYTKIGNLVSTSMLINLSAKGSATGAMAIAGLPFTSNSNSNYRSTSGTMYWDNTAQSYVYLMGLIAGNATNFEILGATASLTTLSNPQSGNINDTSNFRLSITYQTA